MGEISKVWDLLASAASTKKGMTFIGRRQEQFFSYKEILTQSEKLAGKLAAFGVVSEDRVLLVLPTSVELVQTFFALQYLGAIPCIIPELTLGQATNQSVEKTNRIAKKIGASCLITQSNNKEILRNAGTDLDVVEYSTLAELCESNLSGPCCDPSKPAVIQATSGSTGVPKCVTLGHNNLIANLEQIKHWTNPAANDCVVSWLPFYHDMGLVGCFLSALYNGVNAVYMAPSHFLRRPVTWLKAHPYR